MTHSVVKNKAIGRSAMCIYNTERKAYTGISVSKFMGY